jgi:hypothetical protein
MTKQTNYVATVTDANSAFPPKGGAIENSNRGLVSSDKNQTAGSVGAKDHWYIKTDVEPIASYPNNRLPRWQDLIPLSCNFTFSTVQVPSVTPPVLDSTTGITIFFDDSGSMNQVLPALQDMKNNILKPCLLPYYNNDGTLYDQRVTIINKNDESVFQWLGTLPPSGATKTVNLTFSNESYPIYTTSYLFSGVTAININTTTTPWSFLPNAPATSYYTNDINFTNARLSSNIRGISYRVIYNGEMNPQDNASYNNFTKQFYNAVYNGTGVYSGASGLSTSGYAYLIDDVSYSGNGQYYANKVIEGMNLLGYNLSPC